jgi:hypothetical protein
MDSWAICIMYDGDAVMSLNWESALSVCINFNDDSHVMKPLSR